MPETKLNICQVSLNRDIPLIIENFKSFKKIYNSNVKFYIICPKNQVKEFNKKLNFKEIKVINENELISLKKFNTIFNNLSKTVNYKKKFKKRLNWYYQQILKISFAIKFISQNKKNLIIWDADTIILKKVNFFHNNQSINYGNFYEFNKNYYLTNKNILKRTSKYHISFLNQFITITKKECNFFKKNLFKKKVSKKKIAEKISILILRKVFETHENYDGSMFSEFELIGQSNYILNSKIQKPILFLRLNLDGKLKNWQKKITEKLNYKHVTYEHMHKGKKNKGMLSRQQSTIGFLRIILRDFMIFYIKSIFHYFNFLRFK